MPSPGPDARPALSLSKGRSPLLRWPRYFVPDGVAPPVHMPWQHPGVHTMAGVTVLDGLSGRCWPDGFRAEHDWQRTTEGWYLAGLPPAPEALLRGDYQAEQHRPVRDPATGLDWQVRQLLLIDGSSSLPATYGVRPDGTYGWIEEQEHSELIAELRGFRFGGKELMEQDDGSLRDHLIDLAVRVLATSYHLSLHEIALAGWMQETSPVVIIEAAVGMDHETMERFA